MNTKYIVTMLGTSGAGKTVYLASMYRKLSVQKEDTGFFLQVPEDKRQILVNKYNQIIDPNEDWPEGTRGIEEWEFKCCVNFKNINYPIFDFDYIDYAGGEVTHMTNLDIEERARKSDAILALIDGQKVYLSLTGHEDSGYETLDYELSHLMPIVQQLPSKTVHFVITKWDLLAPEYGLTEVREHLMGNDLFSGIIMQRQQDREAPTRLIPVSAVGREFARLDSGQGMTKIRNVSPKPERVEVPLACVLIDGFEAAYRQTRNDDPALTLKITQGKLSFMQIIAWLTKSVARLLPIQYRLGEAAIGVLMGFADKRLAKTITELEKEKQDLLLSHGNRERALHSILINYALLVRNLEKQLPDSNLNL